MNQLLFECPLRRKRDLFLARQRARQIASLLNYDRERQARIAAAVFEVAGQVCGKSDARVRFQISGDSLHVSVLPRSALFLVLPLPADEGKCDRTDLAWAVQELDRFTPLNVVEEARQQNQELLRALQELQAARKELACLRGLSLRVAC